MSAETRIVIADYCERAAGTVNMPTSFPATRHVPNTVRPAQVALWLSVQKI